jgi:hypothetical protein
MAKETIQMPSAEYLSVAQSYQQQKLRLMSDNDDESSNLSAEEEHETGRDTVGGSCYGSLVLSRRLQKIKLTSPWDEYSVDNKACSEAPLSCCLPLESLMMKIPFRHPRPGMGDEVLDTYALLLPTRRHGPVAANEHPVALRNKSISGLNKPNGNNGVAAATATNGNRHWKRSRAHYFCSLGQLVVDCNLLN